MKMKLLFSLLLLVGLSSCVIALKDENKKRNLVDARVSYKYPYNNELNTIDGNYYKKETAPSHFAQTVLELEPGQQLLVMNRALTLGFFKMPDSLTAMQPPRSSVKQWFRIKADSLDHIVRWTGELSAYNDPKFTALITYVDSIVKSTDAYQGLPK